MNRKQDGAGNIAGEGKTKTADGRQKAYAGSSEGRCSDSDSQKERIVSYWTWRSDGFARQREAELESDLHRRWLEVIQEDLKAVRRGNFWSAEDKIADGVGDTGTIKRSVCSEVGSRTDMQGDGLKILDVGTGSGFFAILLSLTGHRVTGIDLTESMICHARKLARRHNCGAEFLVMDAEQLDFPNADFDVVISRNLTWTLPNPEMAYREWMRVLKPGGILLNYDADYGAACFMQPAEKLPPEHAHNKIDRNMMQECQNLKDGLAISGRRRPQWDERVFRQMGYYDISIKRNISEQIYLEQDEFYNPVPMFSIKVVKNKADRGQAK